MKEIKMKTLKDNWIPLFLGVVALLGLTVLIISGENLTERGGLGENCYPNDTCGKGLTCWRIRYDKVCEKEIRPVLDPDAQICYLYKKGDLNGNPLFPPEQARSECFASTNACLKSFTDMLKDYSNIVVRGCN
jgi:hypothetical protein